VAFNSKPQTKKIEHSLDRLSEVAETDQDIELGDILEAVGQRSFGVVLVLAGAVILAPLIGDIPGVPSLMALLVLLTAGQLLLRRRHLWLPKWLLQRSVASRKVKKAMDWMHKPARFVDRLLRPRLTAVVEGSGLYAIAAVCSAIALATPAMELVPFSANGAGGALAAFGLALTARDGLLAILAYLFSALTLGAILVLLF
jgi:hypothetical protein